MDGWVDGRKETREGGQVEGCLGISWGSLGDLLSPAPAPPPPRPLTAATRLFSVMKVRASNGSVSEARVATLSEGERETSAIPALRARCLGCPPFG